MKQHTVTAGAILISALLASTAHAENKSMHINDIWQCGQTKVTQSLDLNTSAPTMTIALENVEVYTAYTSGIHFRYKKHTGDGWLNGEHCKNICMTTPSLCRDIKDAPQ
jgi:hypothetical protein